MSPPRPRTIEEACAATLRALTGDAALHYRGHVLHRGERPLRTWAPHLRPDPAAADLPALRACADGMALRLLHSDAGLHRTLCPPDPVERLVFELLEQLRVDTLAPPALPGLAANLRRRFAAWTRQFHDSGATESSLGILFHTVALVSWSRLNALPLPDEDADLIEATRAGLAPALGPALAGMRRWRHDQARFAPHALDVARQVGAMVRAEREDSAAEADTAPQVRRRGFALLPDFDGEAEGAAAAPGAGTARSGDGPRYRAYTTRHDVELAAATLVRPALLREYRERLDAVVARQGINIPRLARLFGAILSRPRRDDWNFGEEDGRIDGRRLAQLVSSPGRGRVFKRERHAPLADAAVALLIDCSGSMKGLVEPVAALADVLARSLDMAGADCEVLGFTTGAWNGGRPHREWLAAGRPPAPGRLNETCHLVFKDATRRWRRARAGIAALLKADLFREGVDGEAVDWACDRLMAREARRRVLLVVSDGCPMDSATALANDPGYLERHLAEVLARREREGAVRIIGICAGPDPGPYHRRSVGADFSGGLDNALFVELARLMRP